MNALRRCRISGLLALLFAITTPLAAQTDGTSTPADAPSLEKVRERLASGQTTRIVCFGDSITGAYYHTGGLRAWCDMLGLEITRAIPEARVEMINAGISGNTTVDALARIEKDVIAQRPQLVVVMFGMNDATRIPRDEYQANLESIVTRCRAAGAAVVLCTPNSVIENTSRPNASLAEYSENVRQLAADRQVPLVDVFAHWQTLKEADPTSWSLLMSDAIHPNMNGHREFARIMAERIVGREISNERLPEPAPALPRTLEVLQAQQTLKLVALPPYDQIVPDILKQRFPDAKFDVTVWPSDLGSVAEHRQWAERIRNLQPHLVVVSIPAELVSREEAFIRDYEWVLNWSFPFGGRAWDVLPVLPDVAQPESLPDDHEAIVRPITAGKDVAYVARSPSEQRSAAELLDEFIAKAFEQADK